jgi:hypothetical protein
MIKKGFSYEIVMDNFGGEEGHFKVELEPGETK